MENRKIQDRLAALREKMRENAMDYYLMPTADFHGSEYVSDYFKVREYFSNFTGSNGTLLVWQGGAGLWTDGRYFIQAQQELEGTGVELFRMMEEGVPDIGEFLADRMRDGQVLGFDGRVVAARDGKRYEERFAAADKHIRIDCAKDLAQGLWTDRPDFPAGKVTALDEAVTGMGTADKLDAVRRKLSEAGAESLLLTKLDDLMWLFNIRGCDVECNPVAMSYGYITDAEAILFIQEKAVGEDVRAGLAQSHVQVRDYGDIFSYLEEMAPGQKVLADMRYCNYALYRALADRHTIVEGKNPTEAFKAVKNPVELARMREIYLKDSVALTKFIYWLKTNIGKREITEVSAADKLEELRREIPEFLDLSFPTIAGYGPNAAMMHYEATEADCATLRPEGLFLVDSGGQYMGGTTDVTRTIALGPVSEEQKIHYTAVAEAVMQLTHARWLHGCTGRNLDILARRPIWNLGIDYKCGTGHGVGYILNVHEGPQNMRWRFSEGQEEAVLEAGMDITNEPGVYIEGSHGIRIENVMVAQNDIKNEYGQFMHFETLTWVPIDFDAIDEKYLTEEGRILLYGYQRQVWEKISPYLNEEERAWLEKETRAAGAMILRNPASRNI
ncbi:MAG: aminopeptidase P family protein [Clostridium sp.]|nr:aminopeptidase P family protein [Acetatifactor muris]MCM1528045.1 aminopeptidase P family protein [Bacteroides sp.]MCM1564207.1 aminopeptidase P family protein [Clostridium sp.]